MLTGEGKKENDPSEHGNGGRSKPALKKKNSQKKISDRKKKRKKK